MNEDSLARNSRGDWSASADCPSCSVVICTRDRPHYLERCLSALASLEYPRFEVLVVDNAPSDGRARETAARWDVRYTVEPAPGLSRARNRGLSQSKGDIVAYLDDDAIAESGWLARLVEEFSDPLVMAVAGRIVPLALQAGDEQIWSSIIDRGVSRQIFDRETPGWFAAANFGGIGIGANMAVRTRAIEFWSGFDSCLGRGARVPGGEENYAFFELIAAGYRVVYAPAAVVAHHTPQNFSELREQHLRMLRDSGAYLAFLLLRLPDYRGAILKLLLAGLVGKRALQDSPAARPKLRIVPRWREWCAGLRGFTLYTRSRLTPALPWRSIGRATRPGSVN